MGQQEVNDVPRDGGSPAMAVTTTWSMPGAAGACRCARHPASAADRVAARLVEAAIRPGLRQRPAPAQRRRIWELAGPLHCSIIGTCLSSDELRRLLRKLKLGGRMLRTTSCTASPCASPANPARRQSF